MNGVLHYLFEVVKLHQILCYTFSAVAVSTEATLIESVNTQPRVCATPDTGVELI